MEGLAMVTDGWGLDVTTQQQQQGGTAGGRGGEGWWHCSRSIVEHTDAKLYSQIRADMKCPQRHRVPLLIPLQSTTPMGYCVVALVLPTENMSVNTHMHTHTICMYT